MDMPAVETQLFLDLGLKTITAIIILIAGWMAGKYAKNIIQKIGKLDDTLKSFLGGLAKYTIFAVALITVLTQFGVQTASLIAVLGAAGLAIGLALQGTLSNVASGVMLLILRPFNVGDFIVAGGNVSGTVKSLGLFGTEMATVDNVYIFVPNSQIWNTDIQNFSRNTTRRQDLIFGISYSDDINKAMKVIEKIVTKDERVSTAKDKEAQIMVSSLGDFSVNITARIWCNASDYWGLQWDLQKSVKEALDKDGITIPFPTQTVEHLNAAPEPAKKKAA